MKIFTALVASTFVVFGAYGASAQTQPSQTRSTVDGPADSSGETSPDATGKMSPGSTGAMDNAVGGVATSPQDVRKQNEGKTTAADGEKPTGSTAAPAAGKPSPGTVGATPGSDPAAPAK